MVVDRYERRKYACPHGHEVRTAALPDGVIDGAKYDASVHAHVVVAKYQDHLPLNRLESIFKRDGVKLPRQVSWDMVVRVDKLVAQPVQEQMRRELLAEEVLHADETSVTLRLEDQKGSKDSWVFGRRSLREVDQPKALVDSRPGRGRDAGLALRDEVRRRVSSRILERIYAAAEVLDGARSTLPKSKLGKALKCLFNQRAPLTVLLEDARLPIHNNDAERDLRHVVTGRKNCWSSGARAEARWPAGSIA